MTQYSKDNRNIAIQMIWYERFLECSRTQGTPEFPNSVWRFYHALLNIDSDKLAIRDIVHEYVNDDWLPRLTLQVMKNTRNTTDPGTVASERDIVEQYMIHDVFSFIIQAIQDSGLGWPTGDEIKSFSYVED